MNRNCMDKSQQNKGFSLLEVLIAMVILGIIVAPLLHLFVVGARTNSKARDVLRATTAAQNTMEELKSNSLADTLRLINGQTVDANGNAITGSLSEMNIGAKYEMTWNGTNLVQASGSASSIQPVYKTVTNADGTTTNSVASTTFQRTSDDTYCILLKDVTEGLNHYDELIAYEPVSGKTLQNAEIASMNQDTCGYFVQAADEVTNAATEFANRNITYLNTEEGKDKSSTTALQFQSLMQKTISVDIEKDATNGSTTVGVSVTYQVQAGYTTSEQRTYTGDGGSIFNNYGKTDTTPLEAVYIYYYPNYTNASAQRDQIQITNHTQQNVDVYLIAMENGVGYTAASASTFVTDLKVDEDTVPSGATSLCTTICTNLEPARLYRSSDISGITPTIKNLGNTSEQQIYYNVYVVVLKHNDSSFTADGSGNVVYTPEQDDRITTFTGAVLDDSISD